MRGVTESATATEGVAIRYFAAAAEAAGIEEETVAFPPGATLADLKRLLESRYGDRMARVMRAGSFLVDEVVCRDDTAPLGRRIDVLPPFTGG